MSPFIVSYFNSQLRVKLPIPSHSFAGQTIIVTGANTGLGLEAARHFVRLHASKVILAVRDLEKGKTAATSIAETTGRADVVEVWRLDLEQSSSVEEFADRAAGLERLDVVVENAGILTHRFSMAEENERTITVNVVSTMLLALLLLPKLQATAEALSKDVVLTFTGSFVHWLTDFPERKRGNILEELAKQDSARMADRYNVSKLMELLIVRELAQHMTESPRSSRIIASIANPGSVKTTLDRESTGLKKVAFNSLKPLLFRSTEVGARTIVSAAEGGRQTHGQYLDNCKPGMVSHWVNSEDGIATQRRLWEEISLKLESIHPGILKNI